jgi:hypothetical protein
VTPLPARTARLFPHEVVEQLPADGPGLVIARLLEEGDGEDLRWLARATGEAELAAWVRRRGGRKLSRRSRAFWVCVLGVPAPRPAAAAAELWPLA